MTQPIVTRNAGLWGGSMISFESIASTNSWAAANSSLCTHGDIVVTENQTAGRGRFERRWSALSGKSLAVSLVIDSNHLPSIALGNYAQLAALATWLMLDHFKVKAQLKWPNDIMTSNGKLCGILAEHISGTLLVIGIGINTLLEKGDVDDAEFASPLTSMKLEGLTLTGSMEVLPQLLVNLETVLSDADQLGLAPFRSIWRENDYLSEKRISVHGANGMVTGEYSGINDEGQLLIEVNGATQAFSSGDITLSSDGKA